MLFCIYTNVKGKLRHLDRISFLYNMDQNHTKVVQSPKSLSFISGERPPARPPAVTPSLRVLGVKTRLFCRRRRPQRPKSVGRNVRVGRTVWTGLESIIGNLSAPRRANQSGISMTTSTHSTLRGSMLHSMNVKRIGSIVFLNI